MTRLFVFLFILMSIGVVIPDDSSEEEGDFVASTEWKTIKDGQKIPAGLHYRINLETGLKEAKVLEEDSDSSGDSNHVLVAKELTEEKSADDEGVGDGQLLREGIVDALKKLKSEDDKNPKELSKESKERKKLFRSYDELKQELSDLNINVKTDSEIMSALMAEYRTDITLDVQIGILEDLEYLVHQFDNAVNFVHMDGLKHVILPGFNATSVDIRKAVLRLLGSAAQSNPTVQIAVVEAGFLTQLIRTVARESELSVSSNAVFALSCIVRGFPYGQHGLVESGGFPTLREVFQRQDWQSLPIQLKVVSLIQDLIEERTSAQGERLKQLQEVGLEAELHHNDYCEAVSSLLAVASFDRREKRQDMGSALGRLPMRPDHDTVDKVINAMVALAPSCRVDFSARYGLLESLQNIYLDLAYKEQYQEDGHELFGVIAKQIAFLLESIERFRDEL